MDLVFDEGESVRDLLGVLLPLELLFEAEDLGLDEAAPADDLEVARGFDGGEEDVRDATFGAGGTLGGLAVVGEAVVHVGDVEVGAVQGGAGEGGI